MNDDRYDIKGKIGQGGIGAVYRAFDRRLNRDVAIKRVLPEGGFENQDEAIEHLLKEAKSLSSVQHPHIVTVYDAGVDDEGPYVVMELLAGRTLDEMVERGSLTFEDFREVAIQTQEALIAAQDLDLVHRDLKPTNVMVTWLPSGKFQMKLVDFGLAKFSPKPSLQTIDHGDAVFGSIHFMAPEQFERTPLDQRTDMYSMGCMYYFSLTGIYPFGGETAPEVMGSHLQGRVTPIGELRPDLPSSVSDWVMWHIEREMDKRPENARESLKKFLMTEQQNPDNSDGAAPQRPKLVFPGAESDPATPLVPDSPDPGSPPPAPAPAPADVPTGTAPQPIHPPERPQPSVHPPAPPERPAAPPTQPPVPIEPPAASPPAPLAPAAPPAPANAPATLPTQAVPPAAAPPAATPGAAPGQINFGNSAATPPAAASVVPAPTSGPSTFISGNTATTSGGVSNAVKITIAAVLVVAIIFVSIFVLGKANQNQNTETLNNLLAQVKVVGAKDLPTTADEVDVLLGAAIDLEANANREAIYQRLLLASGDGSNVDKAVAEFACSEGNNMAPEIRKKLFHVLQGRQSPDALPYLMDYARNASNSDTAQTALEAARKLTTDNDVPALLNIVQFTTHESVRQSAKHAISSLATRSSDRSKLAGAFKTAYDAATSDEAKFVFVELLGSAGGDIAAPIVEAALKDDDRKLRLAGIAALGHWADDSQFDTLLDYMADEENDTLRQRAFDSAVQFLENGRERDDLDLQDMWKNLAHEAQSREEKIQIIDKLYNIIEDWSFAVVEFFLENKDDKVSYRAEQALQRMEAKRERLKPDEDEPDEDEPDEEDEDKEKEKEAEDEDE